MVSVQPSKINKNFVIQEYIKCRQDPKYFIKNYCYITHPVKGKLPFQTFPFQDDLTDMFVENRYSIILKSRQLGISTIVMSYCAWLMLFFQHKRIVLLSIKSDVTMDLIGKISLIFDNLPFWLKPNPRARGASFNKKSIQLAETGSSIVASSTTKSVGRSIAGSLLIVDECVARDTKIKIRNKKTGEIREISIEDLIKKQDGRYIYV